jgi:hypothetical protein
LVVRYPFNLLADSSGQQYLCGAAARNGTGEVPHSALQMRYVQ